MTTLKHRLKALEQKILAGNQVNEPIELDGDLDPDIFPLLALGTGRVVVRPSTGETWDGVAERAKYWGASWAA